MKNPWMLLQRYEPMILMSSNAKLYTYFNPSPFKGPTMVRNRLRENKRSLTGDGLVDIVVLITLMKLCNETLKTDLHHPVGQL